MAEDIRHGAYIRTVSTIFTVIILTLSFFIIRPFLVAILSAAALAFIFYPVYERLFRLMPSRLPKEVFASFLTCLLIIIIVLVPVAVVTVTLTQEVQAGYLFLERIVSAPGFSLDLPPQVMQQFGGLAELKGPIADLTGSVIAWLQAVLKAIPNVALNILIIIFSTYYFLKHGKDIYKLLHDLFPLPAGRYNQIIKRFDDISRGMIMGQVAVGAIQGILMGIGLVIIHFPNPVLWGTITAIISVIPLLGAAIVWFPIFVYLLIKGLYVGELWRAVFLLIYGSLLISTIDNVLKPKIVGERAKIHPLVVLFGILGGIQLFGIPGILIGPLVLALVDLVIEIYKETM